MINLNKNAKIYMLCPSYNKTGGTELAHQLVYQLKNKNLEAFIVYYSENNEELKMNPAFEMYVDEYCTIEDIADSEDNLLIVPEIAPNYLNGFKNIKKAIWWMSVDNFEKRNGFKGAIKNYGLLNSLKYLIQGNINFRSFSIDENTMHFYQSEYAKQYLIKKDYKYLYKLSDYLNSNYFNNENTNEIIRKDYVLYNPKKGYNFTKKIIQSSKDLMWIPIQNMTTEEVVNLLRESKVYIDFGNHPGKDRFPREAAISGCCVITGRRGSAKYYEDIPISNEYKFDDNEKNIPKIVQKICECINNYEDCKKDFDTYKHQIRSEYDWFLDDINNIFG